MTLAVAAPPRDASLPALAVATGDSAGGLLADALLEPGHELVGCRACYLRYKPGQSCLILYRLSVCGQGGEPVERLAHLRLYAGGRAERIWSRDAIHALASRAPAGPLRAAAYVGPLGALAMAYPVDPQLPALPSLAAAEVVRYKPARKALLRRDGRFVKVYADDRGGRVFKAGVELARAGVPVVEPLGYSSQLRVLVQPAESGTPLASLRGSARYAPALVEAGAALARLHATPLRELPQHSWREELAAAAWAVGVARPDLEQRARRLAEHLTRLLEAREPKPVTSHGDFYDDQVLVAPTGPRLLDLDRLARADPLLDLGTFLAHLRVAGEAGEALLTGYGQPDEDVRVAEAAALLKLAVTPFRVLAPDWPEAVERRLDLAAELVRRSARPRDAALPQLDELADRSRAAGILSRVLGEPVEVRAVDIVRHRPGRRATLRYGLARGVVYAKTFASERAPRVHRTLATLTAAGVPVPEPLALDERLHLVVEREVAGDPATPRLVAGDVALADAVARTVTALHASGAELERRHLLDAELEIAERRVDDLPPRLQEDARERLAAAARDARSADWRLRPIHRDLYPDQVLVDGDGIALLDVDDAAMSEPAVDVANFLAHLRLLELEQPEAAEALENAARAFAAGCARLDPALDPGLVDALQTATLVRLACIHLPSGGEPLAARLIDSARTQWP